MVVAHGLATHQGSLFGVLEPAVDSSFVDVERIRLDERSWLDVARGWLRGADVVFDELVASLPLRQRTDVKMFDRLVDEPRMSAWWHVDGGLPEPMPVLAEMRELLSTRYGEEFDSIGFNLYRDGTDSVAWHGDRHRHVVVDPIVAIVSVGSPRPLRLGDGDLFVMGGACQHEWEHTVPKARNVGPPLSITFRNV
jgi:alkylated DNA repair dioxygenase AlkB